MRDLVREFSLSTLTVRPTGGFRGCRAYPMSDGPSRHDSAEVLKILGIDALTEFQHPEELVRRLK